MSGGAYRSKDGAHGENHLAAGFAHAEATYERLERALHTGPEQRLVTAALELRLIEDSLPDDSPARARVHEVGTQLIDIGDALRGLGESVFPAVLVHTGLTGALRSLSRRSPIVVEIDSTLSDRPERAIEVAAYRLVAALLPWAEGNSSRVLVGLRETDHGFRVEARFDDVEPGVIDPLGEATRAQVIAAGGSYRFDVDSQNRTADIVAGFPVSEGPGNGG